MRRLRPLPARACAPVCSRHGARALPLPAGDLHGDLRLPRLRRRARACGVERRRDRGRERPVPFRSRARPPVSDPVALPFWVFLVVLLLAAWAASEPLVIPA